MTGEHEELSKYRDRAEATLAQYHIKEVAEQESREQSGHQIDEIAKDLATQKEEARETKLELDKTVVSFTRSEMTVQKLSNEIKSKDNYAD